MGIYRDFFSRQAKKPTGLFGRFFISRVFEKGNAELNAFVQENLALEKKHHVLEIGFGTGTLIRDLAGKLEDGLIEGVDFSKTMVDIARRKNRKGINSGKVILRMGDFDSMPFGDRRFDRIISVNTIYFWKNPEASVKKIYDLLKPEGRVVIGFHAKDEMEKMPLDTNVFRYYSASDLTDLLTVNGRYQKVAVHSRQGTGKKDYCAIGVKGIRGPGQARL